MDVAILGKPPIFREVGTSHTERFSAKTVNSQDKAQCDRLMEDLDVAERRCRMPQELPEFLPSGYD